MSEKKKIGHNKKKEFLKNPVEHIDITSFDSRKIISSMNKMSFVSIQSEFCRHLRKKSHLLCHLFMRSNQ